MELFVDEEFRSICREIVGEHKSQQEWAEIESDDMFRSRSFSGGYDADEEAFCFSYYDENQNEFWFQLALDEISAITIGEKNMLQIRLAE